MKAIKNKDFMEKKKNQTIAFIFENMKNYSLRLKSMKINTTQFKKLIPKKKDKYQCKIYICIIKNQDIKYKVVEWNQMDLDFKA